VQGSQAHQHAAPGSYDASPHRTHPVFHDHLALLSAEHVPQEFSPPITNLVCLPRAMFSTCMQGRAATRDHCYSRHSQQTSLKLSVPHSLLRTTCVCSGALLMFCSMCHVLSLGPFIPMHAPFPKCMHFAAPWLIAGSFAPRLLIGPCPCSLAPGLLGSMAPFAFCSLAPRNYRGLCKGYPVIGGYKGL